MNGLWLQEIESLEAISQDEDSRNLFLRMAHMSQSGRLGPESGGVLDHWVMAQARKSHDVGIGTGRHQLIDHGDDGDGVLYAPQHGQR